MSTIIIMLYATTFRDWSMASISSFDIKIGGLNATELFDLKQMAPVFPESSETERFGAWSANLRVQTVPGGAVLRMSSPPVEMAAPFISRIKTWGYKITSYNSYAAESSFHTGVGPNGPETGMIPILSFTWILERESELVFLTPAP